MRSSKYRASENNRSISGQIYTLHQRLYHALNLGTRGFYDDNKRKWHSTDIEIQRHVVRSITAFLDSISGDTVRHPIVKDSVPDMVGALVGILQSRNGSLLNMAANAVKKLVNILPMSVVQPYVLDLVYPLAKQLSLDHLKAPISCATTLNLILSTLHSKNEKAIWEILEETKTVAHIVSQMKDTSGGMVPNDHFLEMTSLLSTILWQWRQSRYPVWMDVKLIKSLEVLSSKADVSVKVAVLKLYSALALCGNGAKNLIENGEAFLQMMVQCMNRSYPCSVRVEGFRLAECLVSNEESCMKLLSLLGEPIVNAIVSGMSRENPLFGKVANDQLSLLEEACRLALVTRWAGGHHSYFWKHGIDKALIGLLSEDFHNYSYQHILSLEELMSIAHKVLSANYLPALRAYTWDILGWLATHCGEDVEPNLHGNEVKVRLNILITCSCLAFVDTIREWCQICQNNVDDAIKSEPASRAVLLMIYSPCKYIASRARLTLLEILKPNGKEYLKYIMHTLSYTASGSNLGMPYVLKRVINLIGLTCYLGLSQYRRHIAKGEGLKTLLGLVNWCLDNDVHIRRQRFAPHLQNSFHERSCCWFSTEDWEGKDIPLLYSLWALAELIHNSCSVKNAQDIFAGPVAYTESELVSKVQEIWINSSTPGIRWYAAYILSFFGFYGFPSKLCKRIGKGLDEKEYADICLILSNGDPLSVHGVVLAVHCRSLLPSKELCFGKKTFNGSLVRDFAGNPCGELQKEIRLSAHVGHQPLMKLLEYIYRGYLQAGEELVKKLKTLAKHCDLQPLFELLCRKSPKYGTPFPRHDLSLALGPAGLPFSDITLEAKETELVRWKCSFCSLSVPHMHVHKVVLWSSCDYMQAMFQSGMQDSRSQTIKAPVSWGALVKLVNWFYTNDLPSPPLGCLWDNMDTKEKLCELEPYVELCWLAGFWLLEDVEEACSDVIRSCLDSSRHLAIKVIQIAANFCLWKLAEVAANYMAPLYRQLYDSGELEELDEMLVDMVRAASVRLSQEGGNNSW